MANVGWIRLTFPQSKRHCMRMWECELWNNEHFSSLFCSEWNVANTCIAFPQRILHIIKHTIECIGTESEWERSRKSWLCLNTKRESSLWHYLYSHPWCVWFSFFFFLSSMFFSADVCIYFSLALNSLMAGAIQWQPFLSILPAALLLYCLLPVYW